MSSACNYLCGGHVLTGPVVSNNSGDNILSDLAVGCAVVSTGLPV